jgi:predicted DNA-binding protein
VGEKMKKKKVNFSIRIEKDLKSAFDKVCTDQGFTSSLIMRELMKKHIKSNSQIDLFK